MITVEEVRSLAEWRADLEKHLMFGRNECPGCGSTSILNTTAGICESCMELAKKILIARRNLKLIE